MRLSLPWLLSSSLTCSKITVIISALRSHSRTLATYLCAFICMCASLVAKWLKKKQTHLPIQEMRFWSLGWEDPLEKEVATSSIILAGEISLTEETGGLQTTGSQKSDTTEQLNNYVHKYGLWGHCFVCMYLCLLYKKEDQTIGFVRWLAIFSSLPGDLLYIACSF